MCQLSSVFATYIYFASGIFFLHFVKAKCANMGHNSVV